MSRDQYMHSYNTMLEADGFMRKAQRADKALQSAYTTMVAYYQQAARSYKSAAKKSAEQNETAREMMAQSNRRVIRERLLFFGIDIDNEGTNQ